MEKIKIKNALIAVSVLMIAGCQVATRSFGGTTEIKVEKGFKVTNVSWKDEGNIWYFIEPMENDYTPKTKYFVESSTYGVLEGKVIFIESK